MSTASTPFLFRLIVLPSLFTSFVFAMTSLICYGLIWFTFKSHFILAILFSYTNKPDCVCVCVCVLFLFLVVLDVHAQNEKERKKKKKYKSENLISWACMLSTWPSSPTSHVALTLPLPSSYSLIPSLTSLSVEPETSTTSHPPVSLHFHPLSSPPPHSSPSSSWTHSFARQHIIISSFRIKCDRGPDFQGAWEWIEVAVHGAM